jgi:hypothetical protein
LRVGKLPQKISVINPQSPQGMIAETEICNGALATSFWIFFLSETWRRG